jgi:hypothetical protein
MCFESDKPETEETRTPYDRPYSNNYAPDPRPTLATVSQADAPVGSTYRYAHPDQGANMPSYTKLGQDPEEQQWNLTDGRKASGFGNARPHQQVEILNWGPNVPKVAPAPRYRVIPASEVRLDQPRWWLAPGSVASHWTDGQELRSFARLHRLNDTAAWGPGWRAIVEVEPPVPPVVTGGPMTAGVQAEVEASQPSKPRKAPGRLFTVIPVAELAPGEKAETWLHKDSADTQASRLNSRLDDSSTWIPGHTSGPGSAWAVVKARRPRSVRQAKLAAARAALADATTAEAEAQRELPDQPGDEPESAPGLQPGDVRPLNSLPEGTCFQSQPPFYVWRVVERGKRIAHFDSGDWGAPDSIMGDPHRPVTVVANPEVK